MTEMTKPEFQRWVAKAAAFAFNEKETVTSLDGKAVMAIASKVLEKDGPNCSNATKIAILGEAFNLLAQVWPERQQMVKDGVL